MPTVKAVAGLQGDDEHDDYMDDYLEAEKESIYSEEESGSEAAEDEWWM